MTSDQSRRRWRLLGGVLAGLIVLLAADRWRGEALAARARDQWAGLLAVTSREAARIADAWVGERCRDALALARHVENVAARGAPGDVAATLRASVESDGHLGAWLLDSAGRPLVAAGAGGLTAEESAAARRVWREGRRAIVGPYAAGADFAVGILHWVDLGASRRVVLLRANAAHLYALVPHRVHGSRTGQTRLVGRRGGEVIALGPYLLDGAVTRPPLSLRRPAAGTVDALAAAGVETSGVFRDLRGRRVVAATQYVPGPGWGLVRSLDEPEAVGLDADQRRLERAAALAVLATVAFVLALVGRVARARRLATVSESERQYRLLAEHAQDLITLVDADGVVRYASPAARRLLGYEPEELVGRFAGDFTERRADVERIRRAFARAVPGAAPPTVEHGLVRRDGTLVWVETAASAAPAGEGPPATVLVTRDVSARAALEAELRDARTLEAVGRLAGGVAHDFNNVLSVVRLNAEELLVELPPGDPRRENVEQMRDAAARAASLTRQLLAVGRRQLLRPRTVSLHDVVRDAVLLLDRTLGERLRRDVRLLATAPRVLVDPEQLRAAVLDLALFARDRMPDGGVLSIETADADGGVRLTVRDTGPPLDADMRARLFEPYFFAAGAPRRVGFGLSTVDGLVRQSGGRIDVDSAPGDGAAFHITLPRAEPDPDRRADAAREGTAPLPRAVAARGRAEPSAGPSRQDGEPAAPPCPVVLLAEDETPMREILARVLERAGYRVIEATDGLHALALVRRLPALPDILITDVAMPELGGPELAARLRRADPGLPVIYMSGYAADDARRSLGPEATYLQKPFALRALQEAVARALAGRVSDRTRAGGRAGE